MRNGIMAINPRSIPGAKIRCQCNALAYTCSNRPSVRSERLIGHSVARLSRWFIRLESVSRELNSSVRVGPD